MSTRGKQGARRFQDERILCYENCVPSWDRLKALYPQMISCGYGAIFCMIVEFLLPYSPGGDWLCCCGNRYEY